MRRSRLFGVALGLWVLGCGPERDADRPAASGACRFRVNATLSPQIGTVGIVEWSSSFDGLESASIEFGLDTAYGTTAPVDLGEAEHRTVLLGMKPSRTYHVRVVARGRGTECVSEDQTLETGPVDNRLLPVTRSELLPDERSEGFLLSGFLTRGPAFILDADGEYVWWYGEGEMGRVAFSRDRRFVWIGGINVAGGAPSMKRVSVDGLSEQDLSADFGEIHHDFTILPDETVAFLQHDGDFDRLMERRPDGTLHEVVSLADALHVDDRNHGNSVHYSELEDVYTVSDLVHDAYFKVRRSGEVLWILGGEHTSFTGDTSWHHQHGHDSLAPDRFLFFSNGAAGETAKAIELRLDLTSMKATRRWQYDAGISTQLYGDAQRLENGNTLVTYSVAGVQHEVDPAGKLVAELRWQLGGALGYATRLSSLYAREP